MKTIKCDASIERTKIKGSRFIGYVFSVQTKHQISQKLLEVRQKHPKASHICYAWILSNQEVYFYDDGEPNGSAGRPILQHIQGKNIVNVLGVSVRYFGGTKLGVGGLIRAYGDSIAVVLDTMELIDHIDMKNLEFHYDYFLSKHVQKILNNHTDLYESVEHMFLDQIYTKVRIPTEHVSFFIKILTEISSGRIIFH